MIRISDGCWGCVEPTPEIPRRASYQFMMIPGKLRCWSKRLSAGMSV